jgi:hypothetical protein
LREGRCGLQGSIHERSFTLEVCQELEELCVDIRQPAPVKLLEFLPIETANRIIKPALGDSPLHETGRGAIKAV